MNSSADLELKCELLLLYVTNKAYNTEGRFYLPAWLGVKTYLIPAKRVDLKTEPEFLHDLLKFLLLYCCKRNSDQIPYIFWATCSEIETQITPKELSFLHYKIIKRLI